MTISRKFFICLSLSLLGFTWVAAAQSQGSRVWWKNELFQKELTLSPDQVTRIDDVFQAASPSLRAQKRAIDTLEGELSEMVKQARVPEADVEQFVVRVEALRADLGKARTMMIFRMHRILSSDQNAKLQRLFEQQEQQEKARRGKGHGQP